MGIVRAKPALNTGEMRLTLVNIVTLQTVAHDIQTNRYIQPQSVQAQGHLRWALISEFKNTNRQNLL
ncbi:MAG: hypothetical protein M2R45_04522 [Verrucomicrobia subdivision 3 bacterium]|nr:hypothetical protein [Limisphaerales bacterium]MCS1416838.1 hypothetical protein [Limisphaerales bacterium]